MRIIVYPHELSIGGSQINAIDLARTTQEAGHEVTVFGQPGPLEEYVRSSGLTYVAARTLRYRPAPSRIAQLARLARRTGADLIHCYEWPPCLDAYFGAHLLHDVPIMCTVLSMSVSELVPKSVPLIMGTEQLGEEARRAHSAPVWVLEPPIDTVNDHPGIDGSALRAGWGVGPDELAIVSVSRLSYDLKLDALEQAIDATNRLAGNRPVRLVLVGGGDAEADIRARAVAVNDRHGRDVIVLPGPMSDPRPAYAAADVVVAMGSSALRAMAIGKPVVVQGERGFCLELNPETLPTFLHQGFWGIGDGRNGPVELEQQLDRLLAAADLRTELGAFGREIAQGRFSLERATNETLEMYRHVIETNARSLGDVQDAARAAWLAAVNEIRLHDPRRKRHAATQRQGRLAAARTI